MLVDQSGDRPTDPAVATLDDLLVDDPPAFALLHRRGTGRRHDVEILTGSPLQLRTLDELPLETHAKAGRVTVGARHEMLALLPFRQVAERGYACHDDGEPILALAVERQGSVHVTQALQRIPDQPLALHDVGFDIDDKDYAAVVQRVLAQEIGRGTGSNFVIKRCFTGTIPAFSARSALVLFRRLLGLELG